MDELIITPIVPASGFASLVDGLVGGLFYCVAPGLCLLATVFLFRWFWIMVLSRDAPWRSRGMWGGSDESEFRAGRYYEPGTEPNRSRGSSWSNLHSGIP